MRSNRWVYRIAACFNAFLIFFITVPYYFEGSPISWNMAGTYIFTGVLLALFVWNNTDA